jgi:hypothetical protein
MQRAGLQKMERALVRKVLDSALVVPPQIVTVDDGGSEANVYRIDLTILGSGRLDEDNVSGSLKGTKDEVAAWLGFRNDADKRLAWSRSQEKAPRGVYQVRIRITDRSPGQDTRRTLAGSVPPRKAKKRKPGPRGMAESGKGERSGSARGSAKVRSGRSAAASQALALPFLRAFALLPWEQHGEEQLLRELHHLRGATDPPASIDVTHHGRAVRLWRHRETDTEFGQHWQYRFEKGPR